MNAGDASSRGLTPEQELLIEGCRSYLDVIHATNAFQVRVCNTARDVLSNASTRISTITNPVRISPAYTFVDPTGANPNFDGSEAWVGAGIWLDRLVSAK